MAIAAGAGLGERKLDHRPQQERRGERVLFGERLRGRRQDLVAIAIELRAPVDHEARRPVEGLPGDEERKALQQVFVAPGKVERPPLGLVVLEIGQPVEPGAQMPGAERVFETGPARRPGRPRRDRERRARRSARLRQSKCGQCLGPRSAESSVRSASSARPAASSRRAISAAIIDPFRAASLILFDEAVDVALEVRDLLQGEANGGRPAAGLDRVGVEWPAKAPADHRALVRRRLLDGHPRQLDKARLETIEALVRPSTGARVAISASYWP